MATPKTWTADDVRQGKLIINRRGVTIQAERRYQFEDSAGDVLQQITGGRLLIDMEWSSLPVSIQDALLTIDTWTYNQILIQEGMNE